MRIALTRAGGISVLRHDGLVSVGPTLVASGALADATDVMGLITHWDALRGPVAVAAESGTGTPLTPTQLLPPVPHPSKIWAAASNYRRGAAGLDSATGRGSAVSTAPEDLLEMAFLKPPSAITGPEGKIVIPPGADTIFPELELCVVIGKETRDLTREQALDAVFGYTIILDVTARRPTSGAAGQIGSRNVRKGYDTFAPIGPWITTRDAISDPRNLQMRLWVNGELQQSASTDGMINGVVELVSYLSHVSTLLPGDLIATGNPDAPDFQKKLGPGDVVRAEIEHIGSMDLYVAAS